GVLGGGPPRRDGGRLAPGRGLRLRRGGTRGRGRVPAAEGARHRPQRRRDLARDDPERIARALRELRQRLQILVGEQLGVGVVVVYGLEHRADGLRLAFRGQDLGLPDALGGQDGALLLAFRG